MSPANETPIEVRMPADPDELPELTDADVVDDLTFVAVPLDASTEVEGEPAEERPPHAEIHLLSRSEYCSLPVEEPPLMGVLLEIEATGEPLVTKDTGPVAHVILALDLSASMNHPEKYGVLKRAVSRMLDDLSRPGAAVVLLSVVIFSKGADTIVRGRPARRIERTKLFRAIESHPLCFGRYTDVAGALGRAGRIAYEQCRRTPTLPVRVYLLTDGRPQDLPGAREMAQRLGKIPADVHALAFGEDADVTILQDLFSGKRGGTVKSVRKETIGDAFERVAEVAQRVVATRCIVDVELTPGNVGGDAFRYRPARVRFPDPCFDQGKRFRADLGTIETGRIYQLLFEIHPREREEKLTELGRVTVRVPGWGGPITSTLDLTIERTPEGTDPGEIDTGVRTARDIVSALIDEDDPKVALRALKLRRELYEKEKRDPKLLATLDKAIFMLQTKGSLKGLDPGDAATLRAHTCTGGGATWFEAAKL